MKIYIVSYSNTDINPNGESVWVKAFTNRLTARAEMVSEFRKVCLEWGYDPANVEALIEGRYEFPENDGKEPFLNDVCAVVEWDVFTIDEVELDESEPVAESIGLLPLCLVKENEDIFRLLCHWREDCSGEAELWFADLDNEEDLKLATEEYGIRVIAPFLAGKNRYLACGTEYPVPEANEPKYWLSSACDYYEEELDSDGMSHDYVIGILSQYFDVSTYLNNHGLENYLEHKNEEEKPAPVALPDEAVLNETGKEFFRDKPEELTHKYLYIVDEFNNDLVATIERTFTNKDNASAYFAERVESLKAEIEDEKRYEPDRDVEGQTHVLGNGVSYYYYNLMGSCGFGEWGFISVKRLEIA